MRLTKLLLLYHIFVLVLKALSVSPVTQLVVNSPLLWLIGFTLSVTTLYINTCWDCTWQNTYLGCLNLLDFSGLHAFTTMSIHWKKFLFALCIFCFQPMTLGRPTNQSKARSGKPFVFLYTLRYLNWLAHWLHCRLMIMGFLNFSVPYKYISEKPLPNQASSPTTYPMVRFMTMIRMLPSNWMYHRQLALFWSTP